MTLFIFLSVIQAIVAVGLVLLVLMQRSEGGGMGLGGGGSPGGVMSARGAADFLSQATKWLAVVFVGLAIVLAGLSANATDVSQFDQTLDRSVSQPAGAGQLPLGGLPAADPLADPAAEPAPAPAPEESSAGDAAIPDPLEGLAN